MGLEHINLDRAKSSAGKEEEIINSIKEAKQDKDELNLESLQGLDEKTLAGFVESQLQVNGKWLTYASMRQKPFYGFMVQAALDMASDKMHIDTDKDGTKEELQVEIDGQKATIDDHLEKLGGVDDIYGSGTKRLVEKFQESLGLHVDGAAGPQTMAHLVSILKGERIEEFQVEGFDDKEYQYKKIGKVDNYIVTPASKTGGGSKPIVTDGVNGKSEEIDSFAGKEIDGGVSEEFLNVLKDKLVDRAFNSPGNETFKTKYGLKDSSSKITMGMITYHKNIEDDQKIVIKINNIVLGNISTSDIRKDENINEDQLFKNISEMIKTKGEELETESKDSKYKKKLDTAAKKLYNNRKKLIDGFSEYTQNLKNKEGLTDGEKIEKGKKYKKILGVFGDTKIDIDKIFIESSDDKYYLHINIDGRGYDSFGDRIDEMKIHIKDKMLGDDSFSMSELYPHIYSGLLQIADTR